MSIAKQIKMAYSAAIGLIVPGDPGFSLTKTALKPVFLPRGGQVPDPLDAENNPRDISFAYVGISPSAIRRLDGPGSSFMSREAEFQLDCGIRDYSAAADLDPDGNLIYDLAADIETALAMFDWPIVEGMQLRPQITDLDFVMRGPTPFDIGVFTISHSFISTGFGN